MDRWEISGRCGGWCGGCEPENEIYLNPIGTWMLLNERGQRVWKNTLLQGTLLFKIKVF